MLGRLFQFSENSLFWYVLRSCQAAPLAISISPRAFQHAIGNQAGNMLRHEVNEHCTNLMMIWFAHMSEIFLQQNNSLALTKIKVIMSCIVPINIAVSHETMPREENCLYCPRFIVELAEY